MGSKQPKCAHGQLHGRCRVDGRSQTAHTDRTAVSTLHTRHSAPLNRAQTTPPDSPRFRLPARDGYGWAAWTWLVTTRTTAQTAHLAWRACHGRARHCTSAIFYFILLVQLSHTQEPSHNISDLTSVSLSRFNAIPVTGKSSRWHRDCHNHDSSSATARQSAAGWAAAQVRRLGERPRR